MITNIDINKIDPHPDNPRKDLGDLSELAESIKTNGILQNLTVVTMDDNSLRYRVVIGHRRLAAAKLAGLTEVPCAIANMEPKQQVATMLLENMTRSDLTLWEQAQGIQMMLDFGESVGDISRQTGFSKSTIQRRVKLLELDSDKFKASMERGATLLDYAELDKIQNIELKNSVLEKVGTSDFKWKLKGALDQEEREQKKEAIIKQLSRFAEPAEMSEGLQFVKTIDFDTVNVVIPEDAGEKKYVFVDRTWSFGLYVEGEDEVAKAADNGAERYKKQQALCARLKEIQERMTQLRDDFVRDFRPRKQHAPLIMELAVRTIFSGELDPPDAELLSMLDVAPPEDDEDGDGEITFDIISEKFAEDPERVLFVAAYHALCMDRNGYLQRERCFNYRGEYARSEMLLSVYEVLEKLGYAVSAEERAFLDGTHELYVRDEDVE